MTTNVEGQNDTPDGSGGESLADFDIALKKAREAMYLQGTRYRSIPTEKNMYRFFDSVGDVQQALGEFIEHVIDGDDFDTAEARARAVQALLCDEESSRNLVLNSILGDEQFCADSFSDPSFIELAVEAIDEYQYGEPSTFFMELVNGRLKEDLIEFGTEVKKTKNAKTVVLAKKARGTALDMAKIATSVAVGVLVANKLSKK